MEVARREFSEMEALKASQELAFFKERLLKSEEDKQAAIAFVNDSWQVHVEQEKGKLQQLQTKNMDDMEAFYQNELKVQLDKQRVRLQLQLQLRMEEFYDNQSKEEEDKRQKELVKLRAEASDLKASREFWKNSVNEWKEKLQDPWADSVWIVLSELPCVIRADQDLDLQKKGRVKKEEATKSAAVVKAKAPPVSATERIPRSFWFILQPACRPLCRIQRSLPHIRQILRRPLSFKGLD